MPDTKITPLFDNVVVKPVKEELKQGGIIIPDSAREQPHIGEVVAVGPGKPNENMSSTVSFTSDGGGGNSYPTFGMFVAVGQKVVYKKWGGQEIKINGEDCVIVEQKDILAIIQ